MYVKYRDVEQIAMDLIEFLSRVPSASDRMIYSSEVLTMLRTRLIDIRNESAYAARDGVTTMMLQERTGKDRSVIEAWSRAWAEKKALPMRRNATNRPWDVGYKTLGSKK